MRALTPAQAGEMIGGLSAGGVQRLIRDNKLKARRMVVRGRGGRPRYLILDTDLDDYLESLPPARGAQSTNGGKAAKKAKPGKLSGVHQFV